MTELHVPDTAEECAALLGKPYFVNEWGQLDNTEHIDDYKISLTNPYALREFGVGDDNDFICFDYHITKEGVVAFHATVNSETGSFIDRFDYWCRQCPPSLSEPELDVLDTIDRAVDCVAEWGNVRNSGWEGDPYHIYRCFCLDWRRGPASWHHDISFEWPEHFRSRRQMAIGGKTIDRILKLGWRSKWNR